jgi:hypothetical protein
MPKLAIIGTSGRTDLDFNKLDEAHLNWAKSNVYSYIKTNMKTKPSKVTLISGGSSWIDHVAVQLFLTGEFAGLELYLPADFDFPLKKYDKSSYEGRRLNELHQKFSSKVGSNTLEELHQALFNPKTTMDVGDDFFIRNTKIAINSDHLLAFTFNGNHDYPVKGGTMDTWSKFKGEKVHLSLDQMDLTE